MRWSSKGRHGWHHAARSCAGATRTRYRPTSTPATTRIGMTGISLPDACRYESVAGVTRNRAVSSARRGIRWSADIRAVLIQSYRDPAGLEESGDRCPLVRQASFERIGAKTHEPRASDAPTVESR